MVTATGRFTAEGLAEGTAVTTSNTPGVTTGGNGATITSRAAGRGLMGYRGYGAAVSSWLGKVFASTTLTDASVQALWTCQGAGGADVPASGTASDFLAIRSGTSGTNAGMGNFRYSSAQTLQVLDGASVKYTFFGGAAVVAGQYWLDLWITKGTTTSNGRVRAQVRNPADGTVLDSYDSGAAANTTINPIWAIRFLKSGGGGTFEVLLDDVAWYEGAGFIDPTPPDNTAPSVDLGAPAVNLNPFDPLTIYATASDPENDTLTYTWSSTGGLVLSGTGFSRSIVAPATDTGGTYRVTCVVTDPGGLTASDYMDITVTPCNEFYFDNSGTQKPVEMIAL